MISAFLDFWTTVKSLQRLNFFTGAETLALLTELATAMDFCRLRSFGGPLLTPTDYETVYIFGPCFHCSKRDSLLIISYTATMGLSCTVGEINATACRCNARNELARIAFAYSSVTL